MTLPREDHIVSHLSRLMEFAPLRKSSPVSCGLDRHHLTVLLLSQSPLANTSANKNRKEWKGCWYMWDHFAHANHFSQKLKLFGKHMNFF